MFTITEMVTPSRTGEDGRLKLVSAVQMMQDCSEMWLDSEPGIRDFFRTNNIAQLLVSRQIEVLRVPAIKERLSITTGVFECFGVYGFRNTIVHDEEGQPCYLTWSTGAFVSLDTGRLCKIPKEISGLIALDPKHDMEYLDRRIDLPKEGRVEHSSVEVRRDDLDYNRHMNNSHYVRIACEFLPAGFEVKRLRVEYRIPAEYGDMLFPRTSVSNDGKRYVMLQNEEGQNHAVMEFWDGNSA